MWSQICQRKRLYMVSAGVVMSSNAPEVSWRDRSSQTPWRISKESLTHHLTSGGFSMDAYQVDKVSTQEDQLDDQCKALAVTFRAGNKHLVFHGTHLANQTILARVHGFWKYVSKLGR